MMALCLVLAGSVRAQTPFYYADDFQNQKDGLLIWGFYNVADQVGTYIDPHPDRVPDEDSYGWIYLSSRFAIFVLALDKYFADYNIMLVHVLFSLEPVDLDAIRSGDKKIKDFRWTVGSGGYYFDWYMSDLGVYPFDFSNFPDNTSTPHLPYIFYKDLEHRQQYWAAGSKNEWENLIVRAVYSILTNPKEAIRNGAYWGSRKTATVFEGGGLSQSFEGDHEVTDFDSNFGNGSTNKGPYFQIDFFRPDGPVVQSRRSLRTSGSYNGKTLDQYCFNKPDNPAPPTLTLIAHDLTTVEIGQQDALFSVSDSVTYNGYLFPIPTKQPMGYDIWESSDDRIAAFDNTVGSSACLIARFPGDVTLTAHVQTSLGIAATEPCTVHVPIPPLRSNSTLAHTHTVTWGTSDANYPQFSAQLLTGDTLPFKLSRQLTIETDIHWIGPLFEKLPYHLQNETLSQNIFKGIKWTSSDSSIVSIDDNGIITANAVGEALITFYTEGTTDDFPLPMDSFLISRRVVVPRPVTTFSCLVGTDPLILHKLYYDNERFPQTFQPVCSWGINPLSQELMTPQDYVGTVLHWTSSNTAVATVDEISGFVRAIAPGSSHISVTATLPKKLGGDTHTAAFYVYVPSPLPPFSFSQGAEQGYVPLHPGQSWTLKVPETVTYNDTEYSLFGPRWTSSDANVLKVSPSEANRFEATVSTTGYGQATVYFQADGIPYSGFSEHGHFSVDQPFVVSARPLLKIASRLADVYRTEADFIPLGANLDFPYAATAVYRGEDYPLVNPTWISSDPTVADIWQSPVGTKLFAGHIGEATLSFRAECRQYGFNTVLEWHRPVFVINPTQPQEPAIPQESAQPEPPTLAEPEEPTPVDPVDSSSPVNPAEPVDPEPPTPPEPQEPVQPAEPPAVPPMMSVRWNDEGEDMQLTVGGTVTLGLSLLIDGATFPYPGSAVDWIASNPAVIEVTGGEVTAKKYGFTTLYGHVSIGEQAWVLSRYIVVSKNTNPYGLPDRIQPILWTAHEALYFSLTGKYLGATQPAQPGIYMEMRLGAIRKVIVR